MIDRDSYSDSQLDGERNEPRSWQLFHLVYLLMFFLGWVWETPTRADFIASALAIAVFLPVYFHAYESTTPPYLIHAGIMELIAWGLIPFAGISGVFHVYACVQCAFQRPKRRALISIGAFSVLFVGVSVLLDEHVFNMAFNLVFGLIVGISCTAAADGIEREQQLRRSQVLERQRATFAERERIAQDLHDLLGQTLTTVVLKADIAAKLMDSDSARAKNELQDVSLAARKALHEIRSAVYNMTATSVETEIELARQALQAAGINLSVDADLPAVPPPTGKALGLTIREATTNIVRHSGASSAQITIKHGERGVHLEIADNGRGALETHSEGAGLNNLRKRIESEDGDMRILRDNGVQILVTLPIGSTELGVSA